MYKKLFMTIFVVTVMLMFCGCCTHLTHARVQEINDQWYKMYEADRNPTKAEQTAYEALDLAGKQEWRKAGKPVNRSIPPQMPDAAKDFYNAVTAEIEAKEGK